MVVDDKNGAHGTARIGANTQLLVSDVVDNTEVVPAGVQGAGGSVGQSGLMRRSSGLKPTPRFPRALLDSRQHARSCGQGSALSSHPFHLLYKRKHVVVGTNPAPVNKHTKPLLGVAHIELLEGLYPRLLEPTNHALGVCRPYAT